MGRSNCPGDLMAAQIEVFRRTEVVKHGDEGEEPILIARS
jgi:hypothetical protein